MRSALLGLLFLLGACGSGADTVCGQACEKVQSCGLQMIHFTNEKLYTYGSDCSAAPCGTAMTECIAKCFDAASCSDLANVVLNGPYHTCMIGCSPFFKVN